MSFNVKNFVLIFIFLITNASFAQFRTQLTSTTADLQDIFFLDNLTGFAVGDSGIVLKTINGGSNWVEISRVINRGRITKVEFFDVNSGLLLSSNQLFQTGDGGVNWLRSFPNTDSIYTYDFDIVNDSIAFVSMDQLEGLKITQNKGTTWSTRFSPNSFKKIGLLSFINSTRGFSLPGYSKYQDSTFFTNDGGFTWGVRASTNGILNMSNGQLVFINDSTGFRNNKSGNITIDKTINGGKDWRRLQINPSYMSIIRDIHIDTKFPFTHYACGVDGDVIKSLDGGDTWYSIPYGTSRLLDLNGVFFLTDSLGWLVGDQGKIHRTDNGGGKFFTNIYESESNFFQKGVIFPNPAKNSIEVNLGNKEVISVQIFTLNGELYKTFNKNSQFKLLDISSLPCGFYTISVHSTKGAFNSILIKE